jgi:hypothetical protein
MAVQERNSEMVSLLSADFIQKQDTAYIAGIVAGTILTLPGLVAFWPGGISVSDSDDLFTNYAYLPGRLGGQTLNGGTAAGDDLSLSSTANATKGTIFLGLVSGYDEVNSRLGLKITTPTRTIETYGTIKVSNGDANWTTSNIIKAIELVAGTVVQWLKGIGTISRGIAFVSDTLSLVRSTADDTSAAATTDLTVDASGNFDIAVSGGYTQFGGRLGGAWTGLSFGSGWGDYGGGEQTGQYKKIGDLVLLRGLVTRSSGVGTTIATLPSGYRPAAYSRFVQETVSGVGRVDVHPDGTVIFTSGGSGWVCLDRIAFSTL